jgi:hypothetical protein
LWFLSVVVAVRSAPLITTTNAVPGIDIALERIFRRPDLGKREDLLACEAANFATPGDL